MTYNVMATPGVVIDAKVVHAGGVAAWSAVEIPLPAIIAYRWFASSFVPRGRLLRLKRPLMNFSEIAMETPVHAFKDLFEQLGLPSDAEAIKRFIEANRPLAPELKLVDAPFWNAGQASFISEELLRDADWAEIVDQLDAALR